jgi:hypothetical protein
VNRPSLATPSHVLATAAHGARRFITGGRWRMISRNARRVALALAAAALAVQVLPAAPVAPAAADIVTEPVGSVAAATGHHWIIEWSRRQLLDAAHGAMVTAPSLVVMAQHVRQMAQADGQQYTAVGRCTTSVTLGGTPCFSLSSHPPAPGTYALVDLEHWQLTPRHELDHFCYFLEKAARIIRAHDAYAIFTTGGQSLWQHRAACAARWAVWASPHGDGTVHIQSQPYEDDLATFMHVIQENTLWARAAAPRVHLSFGVSTNQRYLPSAQSMYAAWKAAEAYLSQSEYAPRCWLNIIPTVSADGSADWSGAVAMAQSFLDLAN